MHSGELPFREGLLKFTKTVKDGGWKRTKTYNHVRIEFPDITEAEVRRFLSWIERAEVSIEDEYAERVRRLAGAKQRAIEADALRWKCFEKEIVSRFEKHFNAFSFKSMLDDMGNPPWMDYHGKINEDYIVVTSATDFHFGMSSWAAETGVHYDRAEARQRLRKHTQKIIKRLPATPEYFVVAVGSDFFHIDGDEPKTTKGTVLQGVDGSPLQILIEGIEAQQEQILMLREIAPVKVVQMVGNHDRVNGYTTLLVLHAWAKSVPGVEVVLDYRPRVYQTYGNTLLCFSHGDGAKPEKLGSLAAVEARQDWGATKYHVAFGGHKHHQRVEEHGGLTYYQLRSLSETDRWHCREGWVGSQRGLDAYLIDKEDGVIGAVYSVE
jgi:hypothetical protein